MYADIYWIITRCSCWLHFQIAASWSTCSTIVSSLCWLITLCHYTVLLHWNYFTAWLGDCGSRPNLIDLLARVFRMKFSIHNMLLKQNTFGPNQSWIYSIGWQKRGLPNGHIYICVCAWFIHCLVVYGRGSVVTSVVDGPCMDLQQASFAMQSNTRDADATVLFCNWFCETV